MAKHKPRSESLELLEGPYLAPKCRVGDVLPCEYRGREFVVGGLTDALIQWPYSRGGGRRSPIVCGDLIEAIRHEAAVAVSHHWGVGMTLVCQWRKALGIDRNNNEGSLKLLEMALEEGREASKTPEALAKLSASKKGVPAPLNVREALYRTAKGPRSAKWKQVRSVNQKKAIADGTASLPLGTGPRTTRQSEPLSKYADHPEAESLKGSPKSVRGRRRSLKIDVLPPGGEQPSERSAVAGVASPSSDDSCHDYAFVRVNMIYDGSEYKQPSSSSDQSGSAWDAWSHDGGGGCQAISPWPGSVSLGS